MKAILTLLSLFLIFSSLTLAYFQLSDNFYEVDPGKFYRSAQLSPEKLHSYIKEYGIKSILNLRGEAAHKKWFVREKKLADKLGIPFRSLRMRVERIPHQYEIRDLLQNYKELPRPILVHCQAGIDRSGLASAIYVWEYMEGGENKASEMLGLKFGHLSWFYPAQTYFLSLYKGYDWVKEQYDPCKENYLYYDKNKFCRPGVDPRFIEERESGEDDDESITLKNVPGA